MQQQLHIEETDERNQAIANRAKGNAYDVMIFALGALMLAFVLMGADTVVLLLLVGTYLFVVDTRIFYRVKLEKEMYVVYGSCMLKIPRDVASDA